MTHRPYPSPYFTTTTSDFYHSTTDCPDWKRGRNAGDGSNPLLPLTAAEALACGKPGCAQCTPTAVRSDPGSSR